MRRDSTVLDSPRRPNFEVSLMNQFARTRSPKILLRPAVTALCLMGFLAGCTSESPEDKPNDDSPAQIALDDADVVPSMLPTVAQMTRIYPYIKGGSRDDSENRGGQTRDEVVRAVRKNACGSWTEQFRAATGLTAMYYGPNRTSPFFEGDDNPTVTVLQFSTEAKAKAAEKRFTDERRRCKGLQKHKDGTSDSYEAVAGADGLTAMLNTSTVSIMDGDQETFDDRYSLSIVGRSGVYLVHVWVEQDSQAPSRKAALQLAELTMTMVRGDKSAPSADDVWEIAPGKLGPLSIGMDGGNAKAAGLAKGVPDEPCGHRWAASDDLVKDGIALEFRDGSPDDLDQIMIYDPEDGPSRQLPAFKTAEGIGLDSTFDKVRAAYGDRLVRGEYVMEGGGWIGYTVFGDGGSITFDAGPTQFAESKTVTRIYLKGGTAKNFDPPFLGC